MGVEHGGRRRRRSHLVMAGSILAAIFAVGVVLEFSPGSGPQVDAGPEQARSASVTPFGQAFAKGIEAMRIGDAHAAARAFDQAREINPHVAEAHVNLGFAYLAMERPLEAATTFNRALEVNGRQVNAYYGLGAALDKAGDRDGAMGAMRTFVHLTDKDDPFRRKALSALWEWESAAKDEAKKSDGGTQPAVAAKTGDVPKQGAVPKPVKGAPKPDSMTVASIAPPSKPAAVPAPAPLPAIAETPEALTPNAGKIAIVNVWASWCGPCRVEMPSLQEFAAALDPARYSFVGLNVDSDRDFAREFIRDTRVSFSNFWDGKGAFARERYAVKSYPQTLFLDSSGKVIARVIGAREWPKDAAEATVAEILAEARETKESK